MWHTHDSGTNATAQDHVHNAEMSAFMPPYWDASPLTLGLLIIESHDEVAFPGLLTPCRRSWRVWTLGRLELGKRAGPEP